MKSNSQLTRIILNLMCVDKGMKLAAHLPADGKNMYLEMAYTYDLEAAEAFKEEVQEAFPGMDIVMKPLSLSVSCHIGPGALALACSKKVPELA